MENISCNDVVHVHAENIYQYKHFNVLKMLKVGGLFDKRFLLWS